MVGIGTDLWLPVSDVIGLVPFSQSVDGSDRGAGIERSTDGGVTWNFTPLPGCLQTCGGDLSLSFINPMDGFATEGPTATTSVLLFATSDGGATWSPVSTFPFQGYSADISFTDTEDGWALTGPTFASGGAVQNPGGLLYRTTDGGTTWQPVQGLPTTYQYNLPTFFGNDAAVLGQRGQAQGFSPPALYVTADGGSTWTSAPLPVAALSGLGVNERPNVSLVALGPASWLVFSGSSIYATTNGGTTWKTTKIGLTWESSSSGQPDVSFFTPTTGWAIAAVEQTPAGSCRSAGCNDFPVLEETTNGGKSWSVVDFNQ